MDLDLLSLPPEIVAKIFSNIPWDQLINVKLCARKFNYVTKRHLKNLQKPKLFEIRFENDYTHYEGIDEIKLTYIFLITNMSGGEHLSDHKEFFLHPSELDQLHSFLQKVDLTSLENITISLDNHREVIGIFSNYCHYINRKGYFWVTVRNCTKDVDSILSFLQKIRNVGDLMLDLHFPHINVPEDFVIPVRNSLKSLYIEEKDSTTFVTSRMIEYIVENNPNLNEYNLTLSNFETYKMIIETIVRGEMSRRNRNNGCSHKHIFLALGISGREVPSELSRYFYSEEFPYNITYTNSRYLLYVGELECPVCGEFDLIKIYGDVFQ